MDELEPFEKLPLDYSIKPGSLQLLRSRVFRGKEMGESLNLIKSLERICKGEPMIGMELYPDGEDVLRGAEILNGLRGPRKFGIKDSGLDVGRWDQLDSDKWNYRIMPTYHPLFAMLMRELNPYIPQRSPAPYMLTIGANMGSDSTLLLESWLLSHPEITELASAMEEGNGDFGFPGIYLGVRAGGKLYPEEIMTLYLGGPPLGAFLIGASLTTIFNNPSYLLVAGCAAMGYALVYSSLSPIQRQTNLYAGLMHPELPPPEEFIHMSGILAKAHTKYRKGFEEFRRDFSNALEEIGLNKNRPVARTDDLYAEEGGRAFSRIARTARTLQPDLSDYIRSRVQQSVGELERKLYNSEGLDMINRAYSGQLLS